MIYYYFSSRRTSTMYSSSPTVRCFAMASWMSRLFLNLSSEIFRRSSSVSLAFFFSFPASSSKTSLKPGGGCWMTITVQGASVRQCLVIAGLNILHVIQVSSWRQVKFKQNLNNLTKIKFQETYLDAQLPLRLWESTSVSISYSLIALQSLSEISLLIPRINSQCFTWNSDLPSRRYT